MGCDGRYDCALASSVGCEVVLDLEREHDRGGRFLALGIEQR